MRAPSRRSAVLVVAALVPVLALVAVGIVRASTGGESAGVERTAARSILNPHPAAGPFAVDDTTIPDCSDQGDKRRCLEQAFGNLAYRTSGKWALAVMAARGEKQPDVSADCHRIAHTIGAAVLAREKGDTATALAEGDSTCWSGFYHGLLERALAPARSADELGDLLATLCDPHGKKWPQFTLYQCLHGIGHGLMLRTGNALDASLELCGRLPDQWSRQSCHGGVFMESFSPSLDLKPPPFDAAHPLEPCPTVAEQYKLYCYLQVADNLVRGLEYDWAEVARACDTEPIAFWRDVCFQSYGRQASGTNYGRPTAVAQLCDTAGESGASGCVYGAARDMASNAASGAPAATFCRVVDAHLVARCFEGVGTIIATLETRRADARAKCVALARDQSGACLRGAGLPVDPS
jgi:hypothetical protein